ncbi:hypothetical protein CC80DRAFT_79065 [Byssothecium circinans]|uniref:Uncharacterized protein n=1 Tax=Byssothecium circinans TaxID=147558 RepID=A0A6A5TVL3_9PLEO|nr:hypothetical protein CC80DRAFT_79065 [Byssothecium circinans]
MSMLTGEQKRQAHSSRDGRHEGGSELVGYRYFHGRHHMHSPQLNSDYFETSHETRTCRVSCLRTPEPSTYTAVTARYPSRLFPSLRAVMHNPQWNTTPQTRRTAGNYPSVPTKRTLTHSTTSRIKQSILLNMLVLLQRKVAGIVMHDGGGRSQKSERTPRTGLLFRLDLPLWTLHARAF